MTNIVERLGNPSGDIFPMCREAADEILRLREELRVVLAHVEELRAEIEQLRGTEVFGRSSHNSAAT
jgi:hypothetical protein